MTYGELKKILEDNNIPDSVKFESDSGWECDPTDMNGVFYNKDENTIIFTQNNSGYDSYGYVCLNPPSNNYKTEIKLNVTNYFSYQELDYLIINDSNLYYFRVNDWGKKYSISKKVTIKDFFTTLKRSVGPEKAYKLLTGVIAYDTFEAFDADKS